MGFPSFNCCVCEKPPWSNPWGFFFLSVSLGLPRKQKGRKTCAVTFGSISKGGNGYAYSVSFFGFLLVSSRSVRYLSLTLSADCNSLSGVIASSVSLVSGSFMSNHCFEYQI